jgi:UDP-N-acetylglucosamine:LPS N-acetylglucosamine transferase
VILDEHQISGARELEASGAAIAFADPEAMTEQFPEVFNRTVEPEALKLISEMAGKITDGRGAAKLVQAIQIPAGSM